MYFGVIVSILVSFSYPLFDTVIAYLILRFLHGFSTGFQPTGATSMVADLIPEGKRGEAMGIFGVTISIGFSLGQYLGSPIKHFFGMDGLFIAGGLLGLLSILFILLIKEKEFKTDSFKNQVSSMSLMEKIIPKKNEIIAMEVMSPSLMMFITAMISGTYMMMIPDFSDFLGETNKGRFWIVNLGFTVITRFLAGRFTDKYGARKNIFVGLSIMLFATLLTAFSLDMYQFYLSSILFGIGGGILSPSIFTWTADLSNPIFKGRGMSTMFIALELGFVAGTGLSQLIYRNNPSNFTEVFLMNSILCVLGVFYLIFTKRRISNN